MCGIIGIIDKRGDEIDKQKLLFANESMLHRGPDSEGFYVDKNVGIAMRRLSIIDLISGSQPMFNETKDVCVVSNGEIYNYQELKDELSSHGFKTKSDTEVLVHGYEEWGIERLLRKINGMFAFCIYDRKKNRLFIARDRIGEKPIYYYDSSYFFVFASELRAILRTGVVPLKIFSVGLYFYLAMHYVPGDFTILEGIKKLEPASYMEINTENGRITFNRYWNLIEKENSVRYNEICQNVRKLLKDSVRLRMIADVPIGVFLS